MQLTASFSLVESWPQNADLEDLGPEPASFGESNDVTKYGAYGGLPCAQSAPASSANAGTVPHREASFVIISDSGVGTMPGGSADGVQETCCTGGYIPTWS
mmetsp:Transcript_45881/g.105956  ORF Transcript_45881/g.105956 Transcript_45881/m.105956 type:complete len:101 (-) Transcript_45881:1031-1333(-)